MRKLTLAELDAPARELFEAARQISLNAHAPYSNFHVGAAIRTTEGEIFLGCNIENPSYGLTSCAERNAIFSAVAAKGDRVDLQLVAVYTESAMASPCGACRQVIWEFGRSAQVVFSAGTSLIEASIAELLPCPFVEP
jgi:cytidine deaminase